MYTQISGKPGRKKEGKSLVNERMVGAEENEEGRERQDSLEEEDSVTTAGVSKGPGG